MAILKETPKGTFGIVKEVNGMSVMIKVAGGQCILVGQDKDGTVIAQKIGHVPSMRDLELFTIGENFNDYIPAFFGGPGHDD